MCLNEAFSTVGFHYVGWGRVSIHLSGWLYGFQYCGRHPGNPGRAQKIALLTIAGK
jgi:hypothetical protein